MKILLIAALSALSACSSFPSGSPGSDLPDLETLTEEWGCGFGFWVSDPDQTASLRIAYIGNGRPSSATLPSPDWDVQLIEGTDLFANWCDDVLEEGEPTPEILRELPVARGALEIVGEPPEPFSGAPLTVRASGLAVELPSGDVAPLGDIVITNEAFGFMAG